MGVQPTVVVADDDEAIRLLCRINLELEGYRVVEAGSASELERVLEQQTVAALLLDVRLGFDDGLQVAERVRKRWPALGIAFFTGSAMLPSTPEGTPVLTKPFNLSELSQTVQRLVHPH